MYPCLSLIYNRSWGSFLTRARFEESYYSVCCWISSTRSSSDPVSLRYEQLAALKRSTLGLDLYQWLVYRTFENADGGKSDHETDDLRRWCRGE